MALSQYEGRFSCAPSLRVMLATLRKPCNLISIAFVVGA
jgi:hypothetical protein